MCFYVIGFLIFFYVRLTGEIIVPPKIKNSSPMTTCLIAVGKSLAKTKLSIFYSSEYESLTSDIIRSIKMPVIVNAAEIAEFEKAEIRFANDLVMVFGPSNVNRILNETFWDAETHFFLLQEREEEMEKVFLSFWNYRVFNVYGALQKGHKILFFSYLPYAVDNCSMGKPTIVDECFDRRFANNGARFQNPRNLSNLNGCPINISVTNINPNVIFRKKCGVETESKVLGYEGNLLYELSVRMNFTAVFRCNPQGIGWLKPTPGGAVGNVYLGESEFAMGVLGPSMERFQYLDLSVPYNVDECLTFGVPKGFGAQNTTIFDFFTFEFDKYGWILVMTMFSTFLFFFVFSNKILEEKWLEREKDIVLELYAGFMGLPVLTPKSSSQKLSVLCWILFSLIVTVAYKSAMGSKLTVPSEDPDINTFQELVASTLQFTGPKSMYLYLMRNKERDPVFDEIVKKFVVVDFETARAVHLIATERKITYLRHRSTFLYNALINPAATGHVHMIDTCVVTYHPSVATRRNSFFTKKLNDLITRLEESGVMKQWRAKFIYKVPPLPQPFLKLGLDRFLGLLWLMVFGYTLSILSFGLEIWLGFKQSRKKKNTSSDVSGRNF